MNEQRIKEEVLRILSEHKVGTLSTMKGDQPFARYMIFRNEEFTLYTISSKATEKVQDIYNNCKVHILLGFEGGGFGKPYIDMTAQATIHDDQELKDRFWHDNFRKYLEGPDDPNYIVIRCQPKTIRLINHPELNGPRTITF
ncbi:pyridoxamine 5'-phosphate oxidase family protein [Anaerobacillus sp. CMMVII]|uniref:pyridoxamine 5'-phosphate oxidase family protein n=1 Tax=Anaerobacillus sp. CMMVII TaxID=2755588 RepID=UPI0021B787A0|nr:pyridoxamine 5'-phosphate oxidase family protein [Anaerobacillus sp. CMMVII]MCT8136890.1 pyridoxamine 5'-phosphate oxidase family protein [Anaerobacillus sp. CMMVII]